LQARVIFIVVSALADVQRQGHIALSAATPKQEQSDKSADHLAALAINVAAKPRAKPSL
jgi:hypothetical protein